MTLFEVAQEISRRLTEHVPARRRRTAAGLRRNRQVPGRSALARSDPLLRILPRRQRRRAWRQPPDRVDRPERGAPRLVRASRRQRSGDRTRADCGPARARAGGRGSRVVRSGRGGSRCTAEAASRSVERGSGGASARRVVLRGVRLRRGRGSTGPVDPRASIGKSGVYLTAGPRPDSPSTRGGNRSTRTENRQRPPPERTCTSRQCHDDGARRGRDTPGTRPRRCSSLRA